MLNTKKSIELTGYSNIDGVDAEFYIAKINSTNPSEIDFSSSILDNAVYKANRAQCRKDEGAFEDMAFEIQDEMIAEKNVTVTE